MHHLIRVALLASSATMLAAATAPTLTTVDLLTGAGGSALGSEDGSIVISYAALAAAAAADEADADSAPVNFRVAAVTSGSLSIRKAGGTGGIAVVPGTTVLLSTMELVWHPTANANGDLDAFTVQAWDGALASATPVQVAVRVAPVNDAPTLSAVATLTGAAGAALGSEDTGIVVTYDALAAAANEADIDSAIVNFRVAAVSTGTLAIRAGGSSNAGTTVVAGTTVLDAANELVWHPAANANGDLHAFTVKACDEGLSSATAVQVTTRVANAPEVPTLTAISAIAGGNEDATVTITYAALKAAANEADADSAMIDFRIAAVTSGTLAIRSAGAVDVGSAIIPGSTILDAAHELRWTPAADASGDLAAFTVQAWDGALASTDPEQVAIRIAAVNDAPTLTALAVLARAGGGAFGSENTGIVITYAALAAAADEADVDSSPVNFRIAAVSSGSLAIRNAGSTATGTAVVPGTSVLTGAKELVWHPAANANGDLPAFTVLAHDGTLASATPVQVVVRVNDAPTLTTVTTLTGPGGSAFGNENSTIIIPFAALALAADEADTDSSPVDFRIAAVSTGTLSIRPAGSAGAGTAVTAGATIFDATTELLWIPPANANGDLAAFTVKAWDGDAASTAPVPVTIKVVAVDDAPTLSAIATLTGAAGVALGGEESDIVIPFNLLAAAADEADADTPLVLFRIAAVSSGTLAIRDLGAGGAGAPVVPGGTILSTATELVWHPATDASGDVPAFTVQAWDGVQASATPVQATVRVANADDAPTLTAVATLTGAAGAALGSEDANIVISYAVLAAAADEADVDSSSLSFRIAAVSTGTLLIRAAGGSGGSAVVPGTTVLLATKELVWHPAANANGDLPAFTIQAFDGALASATPVQVVIKVANVNDPPTLTSIATLTGAAGSAFGDEDADIIVTHAALLAASDAADIDQTPVDFRVIAVSTGTLAVRPAGSSAAGTPITPGTTILDAGHELVWHPAGNANGDLRAFTVKGCDQSLTTATAVQVTIRVAEQGEPPTLTSVALLTAGGPALGDEDTPIVVTYNTLKAAADELDADSSPVDFRIATVTSGTLAIRAAGSGGAGTAVTAGATILDAADELVWTPAANANGNLAAFTVRAWDGALASATPVQVTIKVAAISDPPGLTTIATLTAPDGGALGNEDGDIIIPFAVFTAAADESDPDSATLSFRITAVTSGTLGFRNAGAITAASPVVPGTTLFTSAEELVWHPAADAFGDLPAFTVQAWDGVQASATPVQATVKVANVNDPPTLGSIGILTGAGGASFGDEDTGIVISFPALAAAADEADPDLTPVDFRIAAVSSGTLAVRDAGSSGSGTAVTAGTTVLDPGTELVWHPASEASGDLAAFTVVAWDGIVATSTPVQVTVRVASVDDSPTLTSIPTLTATGGAPLGDEDTAIVISYAKVLAAADEADPDSASLGFRIATVSGGSLGIRAAGSVAAPTPVSAGTSVLDSTTELVWLPPSNANGVLAVCSLQAWDGSSVSATPIPLTISVNPVAEDYTGQALTMRPIPIIRGVPRTLTYAELLAYSDFTDPDGNAGASIVDLDTMAPDKGWVFTVIAASGSTTAPPAPADPVLVGNADSLVVTVDEHLPAGTPRNCIGRIRFGHGSVNTAPAELVFAVSTGHDRGDGGSGAGGGGGGGCGAGSASGIIVAFGMLGASLCRRRRPQAVFRRSPLS